MTGERDRHLTVAQQGRTLAPLIGIPHRADIDGLEKGVVTDLAQCLKLRPFAAQAFRKCHVVNDAELKVGLPGVFHGEKSVCCGTGAVIVIMRLGSNGTVWKVKAMTMAELRRHVQENPSERFIIHLADGRHIPVEHRDFILLPPAEVGGRMVHVYEVDGTLHYIDIYLVTGIELKPNKNGARKKKKD